MVYPSRRSSRHAVKALIQEGLAKAYFLGGKKGDTLRQDYEQAEDDSRAARRGIWK
jgi:endonuclease YncB( thermonuclease family)